MGCSKCETCAYYKMNTKELAIHPSASACTWRTMHTYTCTKGSYTDKSYLPMKGRCSIYKCKPRNTR